MTTVFAKRASEYPIMASARGAPASRGLDRRRLAGGRRLAVRTAIRPEAFDTSKCLAGGNGSLFTI
ncbi:MAG TPA: hypothetical protein VEK57_23925 [Thermoanaerobaculia bacterium]|nr:hypothetical protein [Thermoanaerobaculia bacterium]